MNAEDTRIPHVELARQSEAKRKQAPQSEANVCRRRKCSLKKTSLINCTGHQRYTGTQDGTQVHRTLEVRERNKYIYSCLAVYPLMCAPEFITSCPHRATDVIFQDIKLSLCWVTTAGINSRFTPTRVKPMSLLIVLIL